MRLQLLLTIVLLLYGCAGETMYRLGASGPVVTRSDAERQGVVIPIQRGDEPPFRLQAILTPMPPYPRDLAQSGVTGSVCVRITVQPDGSVSDAIVLDEPPRSLASVVTDSMLRWKFVPASTDGRVGPITGTILVNFSLRP